MKALKKIAVIAMSRTGHHAVAEWIGAGLAGRVLIGSDCQDGGTPRSSREASGFGSLPLCTVHCYESFDLDRLGELEARGYEFKVLVVRTPRNWLASQLTMDRIRGTPADYLDLTVPRPPNTKSPIELFRQHGQSFSGVFDAIVHFDSWIVSPAERDVFIKRFGLGFDSSWQVPTTPEGGGSSFPDHSDQLNRYKLLEGDPEYERLLPLLVKP